MVVLCVAATVSASSEREKDRRRRSPGPEPPLPCWLPFASCEDDWVVQWCPTKIMAGALSWVRRQRDHPREDIFLPSVHSGICPSRSRRNAPPFREAHPPGLRKAGP